MRWLRLLICAACGWSLIHHNRQVTVLVRDAQPKHAIAGAALKDAPFINPNPSGPPSASGTTDRSGLVRLQTKHGTNITASADGYLSADTLWLAKGLDEPDDRVTLELYSGPAAQVDFVLPIGFKG